MTSDTKTVLEQEQLDDLLAGLVVLGTGGGGDPVRGAAQMAADYAKGRRYELIAPEDVPDDAFVVSGGFIGHMAIRSSWAETIGSWEKDYPLERAVRAMERLARRAVDYLVPFELGGGNTPAILSAAARMGIATIDGDGIGRAAPETQMSSFVAHGVPLTPIAFASTGGAITYVEDADLFFPDDIGRFIAGRKPGLSANCHHPMTGAQLKRAVVPATISEAVALGRAMRRLKESGDDLMEGLSAHLHAAVSFTGRVSEIRDKTEGGFYWSEAHLTGEGASAGHVMRLLIKNEIMAGWIDESPVGIFPDHFYLIDYQEGTGLLTRHLHLQRSVGVIGRPCHARVRETLEGKAAQRAFSGARFGCEIPYRPMEELIQKKPM